MALTYSWPGVSALATTTDARKALAGLIETNTSGVVRSGVFPSNTTAIVTARGDMNINIAAFAGVANQFGGPILMANDGVAQLPSVLVSPGAGTNYYVVYFKQNESTAPGTDAGTTRVFGAQLSTTSFAVARAALPAGATELATVQMPTGKTATNNAGVTITQTFQYTAAEGGVVWLRNSTEQSAWTPADGGLAWRMDTGQLVEYMANASTPGWYQIAGKPDLAAITPNGAGGAAAGTPAPRVIGQNGRVYLEGIITVSSATYNAGTTYGIGLANAIPAAFAPKVEQRIPVSYNFVYFGELIVGTDGSITWRPASTLVGAPSIYLVGSWPNKALV